MSQNQTVEIIVHVDEHLGEERRMEVVSSLAANDGIYKARFSQNRNHLMLVEYNRTKYKAQDILRKVMSHRLHAELIGPI
jgi:hypothetical protein